MNYARGIIVGILYLAIYLLIFGLISTPLYTALVWTFGPEGFSDRTFSALPYVAARFFEVGISAMAGSFVAAWVCSRVLNAQSRKIALTAFVALAALLGVAGIIMEGGIEWYDFVMAAYALGIAYGLGDELLMKKFNRDSQAARHPSIR